jgi:hypothetical protein
MLRLTKALFEIALGRQTPANLPASTFLLGLVACAAALLEVVGALLPPGPNDGIPLRIVLSIGLPLGFTWAVLKLARRRQRFLQTAIALLGIGVLAEIVLYPVGAILRIIGADRFASIPLGLLLYVGLIWYLLGCANIWRAALDSGFMLGGVISVGYLVLSIALEQLLLPQT